jgi:hypothetical protein
MSVVSHERRLLSCNGHAISKITLHIENIYKNPLYTGQTLGNENFCQRFKINRKSSRILFVSSS